MNEFEKLLSALSSLNSKLKEKDINIEITIVGSMAIYLNDFKIDRYTEDIDYISYRPDELFVSIIKDVAEEFDLKDDWINSRADSIKPLPEDIENNLIVDDRFSNIKLKVIKRNIIIKMKIYAAYIRGLEKDYEDLELLEPSKSEIENGIDFLEFSVSHHHGVAWLEKNRNDIINFTQRLYERFL